MLEEDVGISLKDDENNGCQIKRSDKDLCAKMGCLETLVTFKLIFTR